VAEIAEAARAELAAVRAMGGAVAAIESGFMKRRLVESNARRLAAIERGEQIVVGVNRFTESAPSPLLAGGDAGFLTPDATAEAEQVERLAAWRAGRNQAAVQAALAALGAAARDGTNLMPPSVACAKAGATTGEWAATLRAVFGEYRAPTGVGEAGGAAKIWAASDALAAVRRRLNEVSAARGRRLKMLVGKPGLDGHSSGAEQIALKARDVGFEVVYEGIRLTPAQIVNAALEEGVHVVGLSILSGSHAALVAEVMRLMTASGIGHIPVVVGGIIPPEDAASLQRSGVARIYTPKDFDLTRILGDIVELLAPAVVAA
jgi:(2R)-ethylmalonyl-CoA mutase